MPPGTVWAQGGWLGRGWLGRGWLGRQGSKAGMEPLQPALTGPWPWPLLAFTRQTCSVVMALRMSPPDTRDSVFSAPSPSSTPSAAGQQGANWVLWVRPRRGCMGARLQSRSCSKYRARASRAGCLVQAAVAQEPHRPPPPRQAPAGPGSQALILPPHVHTSTLTLAHSRPPRPRTPLQMWRMRSLITAPCSGLKRNLAQRLASGSMMRDT